MAPHAEAGVVARAIGVTAGRHEDGVTGGGIGALEVPAEADWRNDRIGQAAAGIGIDFGALDPVVGAEAGTAT